MSLHSYPIGENGFLRIFFSDKINFSEPSHDKKYLINKRFLFKNDRYRCLRMQRKAHQRASLCLEREAGFVLRLMRGSFLMPVMSGE